MPSGFYTYVAENPDMFCAVRMRNDVHTHVCGMDIEHVRYFKTLHTCAECGLKWTFFAPRVTTPDLESETWDA